MAIYKFDTFVKHEIRVRSRGKGTGYIRLDFHAEIAAAGINLERARQAAKDKMTEIFEICPLWNGRPALIRKWVRSATVNFQKLEEKENIKIHKIRWMNSPTEGWRTNNLWSRYQ